MKSMLIIIAVVLFITYLGFCLSVYFRQSGLLYWPVREVASDPGELRLAFESVSFRSADGVLLTGWYVPAQNSDFTLLFCHGNGGNISHRLDSINIFHNLGLNCFIFDYRGYGESEGKPTEEGTYADAGAAYKWLIEEKNISAEDIIIFGRSLGGAVAARLASEVEAAALVVEGSFTSYVDMGRRFYPYMPVRLLAKFSYSTIDYIGDVDYPVMIIHSRDDELVPFEFGQQLYEAANEPKEFVEISGGHNDGFLVSGEVYNKALGKWLKFLKEYKAKTSRQRAF